MTTTETIKIQVGEQVIELSAPEKEAFLADREKTNQTRKAEADAKAMAKAAVLERLGITADEASLLLS
jgi:hypothetical protein